MYPLLNKLMHLLLNIPTNISYIRYTHISFMEYANVSSKLTPVLYSHAHKLFGHSRVFILTIMIYEKRIIFSNDCISKRLKDRKITFFS